jgi:prolyl 4-hydroxylase
MKLEHLIILLLIILIIIIFTDSNKKEFFTTFDYASMDDLYEEPFIINNIITEKEAKYIIENATSKFEDSLVVGDKIQGKLDTDVRKSKTAWLHKDDPIINDIITRIANIVNIPIENAESLQVVKYGPNGYYKHHHDSCCDNTKSCQDFIKNGGQRIKTVLIYLNDDFTEGETDFPELNKKIKPPKYCAVVFNPLSKNSNKCHPKALHAGLPVKSGTKYVANLWFREGKFE